MNLQTVDLNRNPRARKQAKKLYLSAFPREERLPWGVLRLNAMRRGIDVTGWMEGEKLLALTVSVTVDSMHFLLFFAVAEDSRGRGIGSAVLAQLRQRYVTVTLNVEPLLPDAPNPEQRQRRFRFYGRNGFFDTGWHVWEVGGMFRVLATSPVLDVSAYRKIFRRLSFGLWKVKLVQAEDPV